MRLGWTAAKAARRSGAHAGQGTGARGATQRLAAAPWRRRGGARRSPAAGASRRRCGAGSWPGRPTGPGARGYGPRRRAGRPRSGARGGAERPRRRDGEPAAVAAVSAGEKVGKLEKVTGMLTVLMDWMEEGRKMDIDEGGGARWSFNGGRVRRVQFQPGDGPNGLRDGRRGCGVRRGRLGHTGSRRDGDGWSEQRRRRSLLARARLNPCAMKEKGMRTRSLQRSRTDKACAEGEVRRRPTRGDANVEIGGELAKTGQSPLTEIEWFLADFDHPKLEILHWNMKFGQNRSCRER